MAGVDESLTFYPLRIAAMPACRIPAATAMRCLVAILILVVGAAHNVNFPEGRFDRRDRIALVDRRPRPRRAAAFGLATRGRYAASAS